MKGVVKNIVEKRGFGFVRGEDKLEYFFHKENFVGHWDDLVTDVANDIHPEVEFEGRRTPKGPRADNVRRTNWPNEG